MGAIAVNKMSESRVGVAFINYLDTFYLNSKILNVKTIAFYFDIKILFEKILSGETLKILKIYEFFLMLRLLAPRL